MENIHGISWSSPRCLAAGVEWKNHGAHWDLTNEHMEFIRIASLLRTMAGFMELAMWNRCSELQVQGQG